MLFDISTCTYAFILQFYCREVTHSILSIKPSSIVEYSPCHTTRRHTCAQLRSDKFNSFWEAVHAHVDSKNYKYFFLAYKSYERSKSLVATCSGSLPIDMYSMGHYMDYMDYYIYSWDHLSLFACKTDRFKIFFFSVPPPIYVNTRKKIN